MTNLGLADTDRLYSELKHVAVVSDEGVLGDLIQPCDQGQDFVSGTNNYCWWWLLGHKFKPKCILEIGSRYGYSAWAVMRWCGYNIGLGDCSLTVYDAEIDGEKTLHVMEEWFRSRIGGLTVHRTDTQKLQSLYPMELVDWATVDADHSKAGVYHDCELAWPWVRSGGVMAVDDTIEGGEVRAGVEQWALERGLKWQYIPSLRGIHVFEKGSHGQER